MLKKLNPELNTEGAIIPIGKAEYPNPFKSTLEFNAPAHGVWNIVHTGMLIPESHQIYICSPNCMRGVVLTAAEMNAQERFSQVLIEEKDVLAGSMEKLTVDGVCDCLNKLPKLPKAVLVFTVCIHHFMGADLDWIYRRLAEEFPGVAFIRCFMDPIMKKSGLTPDQKIRKSLYEPIKPLPVKPKTAALLGSDFALDETSDLKTLLKENGYELKELPLCRTYEEYLSIGESKFFICCYPPALAGAKALAGRLGRPLLYLPQTFDFGQTDENKKKLISFIEKSSVRQKSVSQVFNPDTAPACLNIASDASDPDLSADNSGLFKNQSEFRVQNSELKISAREALYNLRKTAGETEMVIDYTFHPRPLGLAKLLLEYGFNVTKIYLDAVSGEEEHEFYCLKEHYPDILLCATVHPKCRLLHETESSGILALGQKAAWFTGTKHFVNIVEGAGWYGYDGIIKLAKAAEDALKSEKDPEDYITVKGLGCESCIL